MWEHTGAMRAAGCRGAGEGLTGGAPEWKPWGEGSPGMRGRGGLWPPRRSGGVAELAQTGQAGAAGDRPGLADRGVRGSIGLRAVLSGEGSRSRKSSRQVHKEQPVWLWCRE